MIELDQTHDPKLTSWVASANGHADFPIQNLPLGIFSPGGATPRAGVAIGDAILDLRAVLDGGLLSGSAERAAQAARGNDLNNLLALGAGPRRALRQAVSNLLAEASSLRSRVEPLLYKASDCLLDLPARIGDYTDFYVGIHHATTVGKLFRPDNPLLPNYKYVPIGYHGRASSVRPSGIPLIRPLGQAKRPEAETPTFGPSTRLDYELELGVWVGPGNELGVPIGISAAADHLAGLCLLNDWSARDIQAWEYQPLGPFLAKNFATTISPWIVTAEALAPFRIAQPPRPAGDPTPLPYLTDAADQAEGAFDIELEVLLTTAEMRARGLTAHPLARSNALHMYWTAAQMITHHTSNGCNLRPGDLLGTGTISGPGQDGCGSLLEASQGGKNPIRLETGEERHFLEDGDEVLLRGRCRREGFAPIGFGECRAVIRPAL
ncbi:fumarylacetoacetase [Labrys okinawensis]|uniref:fumarylacetoacetase n=1 Tax=Labrys okinawensis TaxID=346911 RepID=A0A2S9Q557_9HYPH|nr:fumarylacetoacetase [Labrys okinawensis]PRH84465.1 fumarylacetoacetase [Labrys okinawensis]